MNNSPAREHFYDIGGGTKRPLSRDMPSLMDMLRREMDRFDYASAVRGEVRLGSGQTQHIVEPPHPWWRFW